MIALFLRLFRPPIIISVALFYALGAGIAHYLGITINWGVYWLGQAWVTLVQVGFQSLADYFTPAVINNNEKKPLLSESSGALGEGKLPAETAFWLGLTCLAVAASLTVMILTVIGFKPVILIVLFLLFMGGLFYSTPPLRLITSGYGELTASILIANLVPALGFLLQYGEFHRLLSMATFPLTALQLAMMMAFSLPGYAVDLKLQRFTLMTRMGWERGMLFHNILILFAFLLIGAAPLMGFPVRIALPPLLALPIGIYQVWQMRNISQGLKPNWRILSTTALASFCVTAYLMLFAFWIN